jgi:predicted ATPase
MKTALFEQGATWVRADFHLHTKADKEFAYAGEDDFYNSSYVDALLAAKIRIGLVANHNKFDVEEFKALRKTAKKKDVFLLPGVELSVNDGANGIHALIVFSDEWLSNNQDFINQFLNVAFAGKTPEQYENENGRCSLGLCSTIEKLEGYHKDFFIVCAHVEDPSGLWHELDGGRLAEFGQNEIFKRRVLGFQKVRTHDKPDKKCRVKAQNWFGDAYPAEVEGSDPKKIEEVGKGEECFLKLGAFTFEAVKFALVDKENRLRPEAPEISHSHIRAIEFTGGTLNEQSIALSPELNTFIGIRGSGKSSVLESLRYALGIDIEDTDADRDYKHKLVERTLGSGGKIVVHAIDRHGQPCQIRRIWKESAGVFYDDKLQPGISIRETVLHKPLFFGQKELATAGKGSEKNLIEKLLGTKCDAIRGKIAEQRTRVLGAIDSLSKVHNVAEQIEEQTKVKQDAEFRLKFYKEHNLEEKLQKRLGFDADIRKAKEGVTLVTMFAADIRDILAKYEDELRNFPGYASSNNAVFFKEFDSQFSSTIQSVDAIKAELAKVEAVQTALRGRYDTLMSERQGLTEEFASIERALAKEMNTSGGQNISSDEFLELKKKLSTSEATLALLAKSSEHKTIIQKTLSDELQKLKDLWHEEFQIIKKELDTVSQKNRALSFPVAFKEDKQAFLEYFKGIFRGSGVRDVTFQNIINRYQDFTEIYSDFGNAKKMFGSNPESFASLFEKNLKELLVYQPPNKFTISYRGTELLHHSLGQRASALILFVLGQRENDVVIIDQPEDDLDNQTIYEDIIKLLRALKLNVQFVFATHNPNIPVLGDAEQILACSFEGGSIDVQAGSLDEPEQQHRIVNIMEGGKEAFEKRREIYQIWKP